MLGFFVSLINAQVLNPNTTRIVSLNEISRSINPNKVCTFPSQSYVFLNFIDYETELNKYEDDMKKLRQAIKLENRFYANELDSALQILNSAILNVKRFKFDMKLFVDLKIEDKSWNTLIPKGILTEENLDAFEKVAKIKVKCLTEFNEIKKHISAIFENIRNEQVKQMKGLVATIQEYKERFENNLKVEDLKSHEEAVDKFDNDHQISSKTLDKDSYDQLVVKESHILYTKEGLEFSNICKEYLQKLIDFELDSSTIQNHKSKQEQNQINSNKERDLKKVNYGIIFLRNIEFKYNSNMLENNTEFNEFYLTKYEKMIRNHFINTETIDMFYVGMISRILKQIYLIKKISSSVLTLSTSLTELVDLYSVKINNMYNFYLNYIIKEDNEWKIIKKEYTMILKNSINGLKIRFLSEYNSIIEITTEELKNLHNELKGFVETKKGLNKNLLCRVEGAFYTNYYNFVQYEMKRHLLVCEDPNETEDSIKVSNQMHSILNIEYNSLYPLFQN